MRAAALIALAKVDNSAPVVALIGSYASDTAETGYVRESAALALGAGQLLSAVTASPPPPGASPSSAAPPSAAGPIAVGATELDHFDAAHNASLQWGTWRPGEYFGLRSRTAVVVRL